MSNKNHQIGTISRPTTKDDISGEVVTPSGLSAPSLDTHNEQSLIEILKTVNREVQLIPLNTCTFRSFSRKRAAPDQLDLRSGQIS